MCSVPREPLALAGAWLVVLALLSTTWTARGEEPSASEIVRRADQQRGVIRPHRFVARIALVDEQTPSTDDPHQTATVVEVRANGLASQLVLVAAPTPGDAMLVTPDVVWLRPRRLHRLTRIPADLRMFDGASVSDVTAVDLVGSYRAIVRDDAGTDADEYVLELTAAHDGIRYPRVRYAVGRSDFRPRRIDFMAASGRRLKTILYTGFDVVLGQTAVTRLVVQDHVYRDSSIVEMSDFELLTDVDPGMFVPDYLLTLPDAPS